MRHVLGKKDTKKLKEERNVMKTTLTPQEVHKLKWTGYFVMVAITAIWMINSLNENFSDYYDSLPKECKSSTNETREEYGGTKIAIFFLTLVAS